MACRRSYNNERAKWREKCREKLSEHISVRLGIKMDPEKVRLITNPDDPYVWHILPGREHLFSKHMSKLSTGAYIQLCRELGSGFEAVPTEVNRLICNSNCLFAQHSSFKSTIEELEANNKICSTKVNRLQDSLTVEINRRESAEYKLQRSKEQMQTLREERDALAQEVKSFVVLKSKCKDLVATSRTWLDDARTSLEIFSEGLE
ncbi:hypothetical protein K469DRAFT_590073 [Zopfia rhizophila CBS 207.26]|uniref:Uncharacterized protein n=1 Tax=Zopfia rhizophila CBS 207.26 TaxID=1314779 RepID=A0A6A6DNX0_9PEZI|nr:hypothetical protein K469DRAFT_590073 [Zopfia rhizophila CBS 207.26]